MTAVPPCLAVIRPFELTLATRLPAADVAVLTAITLADETFKAQAEVVRLRRELDQARLELDRLRGEIDS